MKGSSFSRRQLAPLGEVPARARFPTGIFSPVQAGTVAGMSDSPCTVEDTMSNLPPSDSVLHLLAFVALAAQAMATALAARRRSMDWAGVCMLGSITALGGD